MTNDEKAWEAYKHSERGVIAPHEYKAFLAGRASRDDEVEALRDALQNAMGHLDTPISRRKIGLDTNEEWLNEARALLEKPNE